ncbi:MAG: hypothetical protein V4683_01000 [Bacteroidota bacterium]
MTITLLEYFKIILEKVSFDAKLFEKELRKAICQLIKSDLIALKRWCIEQFGKKYRQIIKSVFGSISFRKRKKTPLID